MTPTHFFFHCFKVWVKLCVTCTLNWKQNIDFSLSRISTGVFPHSSFSYRTYMHLRFEALHTTDKHWVLLQDNVLNSVYTKSSAEQLFYGRLLTEVVFQWSAFSVSFKINNNVWGLLLCLVLSFYTFMQRWSPTTKKKRLWKEATTQ